MPLGIWRWDGEHSFPEEAGPGAGAGTRDPPAPGAGGSLLLHRTSRGRGLGGTPQRPTQGPRPHLWPASSASLAVNPVISKQPL